MHLGVGPLGNKARSKLRQLLHASRAKNTKMRGIGVRTGIGGGGLPIMVVICGHKNGHSNGGDNVGVERVNDTGQGQNTPTFSNRCSKAPVSGLYVPCARASSAARSASAAAAASRRALSASAAAAAAAALAHVVASASAASSSLTRVDKAAFCA